MRIIYPDTPSNEWEHLRAIVVPSGIGEFQWLWTKFHNIVHALGTPLAVFAVDGAPRRLHQFAELHPGIETFGYLGVEYTQIREFQKHHRLDTWRRIGELFGPGQLCMLACNPHLEAGKPLCDWLPDVPTAYRYPLVTNATHKEEADRVLVGSSPKDLLIGISCASYRGASAWRTWTSPQWLDLMGRIQSEYPEAKFVLLGGSWDDVTSAVYRPESNLRFQVDYRGIPPVGTTTFGGAVEILQRLDGYIGFSSGLGHVAAHNCDCPVFMLWPEHEQPLSTAWVDPILLANGRYVPSRWLSVDEVWPNVKAWIERIIHGSK
jgi:hypothetical protein